MIPSSPLAQNKFFPKLKTKKLGALGLADPSALNEAVTLVNKHFPEGRKVKLVVGHKMFKRKQTEIKQMVENSTHFK